MGSEVLYTIEPATDLEIGELEALLEKDGTSLETLSHDDTAEFLTRWLAERTKMPVELSTTNAAREYVASRRGNRVLHKTEFYDRAFSLKCRVCELVDHVESTVHVDALALGQALGSTVKGVCPRCGVNVYIHHAHPGNFEFYYRKDEVDLPAPSDAVPTLRQLYLVLALHYHPDKAGAENTANFQRVQELYEKRDYEGLVRMHATALA